MTVAPAPAFYRMTLTAFLRQSFLGKPPSRAVVKAAIRRKEWAGEKVVGSYFIFVDERGQPIRLAKPASTGNSEADELLLAWEQGR